MKNRPYRHFGDFVDSFTEFEERLALTTRPFIKIERVSYSQLQQRVYQVAHYLRAEGITSGERIMVAGPNSPQWVELFLGAQLIGAIIVPVDTRSPIEVARKYASQTTPKLVFRSTYMLTDLDKEYNVRLLENLEQSVASQPQKPPPHKLQGEETALIVFTSGTTADPKGVVLTQQNVLANVSGVQRALTINPAWRALSVLPLSHMYELTGTMALLSAGCSIFYMPRVTPHAIAHSLHEYRITTILAVPQLLTLFLQRIRQTAASQGQGGMLEAALRIAPLLPFTTRRLLFRQVHSKLGGHLDMVVTGGAPIPIEIAVAWERMGVKMVQGYGLTETSPVLTLNNPANRRLDSPGRPLDNVHIRIAEDDHEIQAKGPAVFHEYWRNKQASRAAFSSDGWFKTGDIGSLTDGWLQIKGRAKFAIVLSSGLKVFPEDIESSADKHPTFKSICIVGVKRPTGETVQAVVVSERSDTEITKAIGEINQQLESFQHISGWVRWPEPDFPRTRLLKIDRRRVQGWANEQLHTAAAVTPAETASSQDSLLHILRLSLNEPTTAISESDRLADIGLDSLRRLTVVSLIEEQLGVSVAESKITQRTTVAELRQFIAQGTPAESLSSWPKWPFHHWIRWWGNVTRDTLVKGIIRIWVKQHTEGLEHIVGLPKGPALYIFNHADGFDAPVIYNSLPRAVRWRLAAAQADDIQQRHKILAFVSRFWYAAFGFARHEPFMPSLEYTAQLVDQGWNIAIAPEGKLSIDGTLQPFKSGVGLLAVELGIPVVPIKTVGLYGTVPLHASWPQKRSRVIVRIGSAVRFDHTTSYDQATKELYQAMERL